MGIGYVRVVNFRVDMAPDSQPEEGEIVIPVDRRNPILGNRHILRNKLDRHARARVLSLYERDVDRDFASKGPIYQAIKDLALRVLSGDQIAIQCGCRPLPCHADIIADRINRLVAEDSTLRD